MANITGDGNFTIKLNQRFSSPPAGMHELLSALNIFLSITASLGNVLILIALHKVSSIHPPTKLLFRCLAVSDLCVGLIVQPFYVILVMSPFIRMNVQGVFFVYRVYLTLSWILCAVSILTSAAISVDRLLALLLGLRHRHVVTLRRVHAAIICFWFIGAFAGWIRMQRTYAALKGSIVIFTLFLVTTIFSYTKIHLRLRHQEAQLHNNVLQGPIAVGGGIPLNITKYKKTVSSILWVQLAIIVC